MLGFKLVWAGALGLGCGYAGGRAIVAVLNRISLPSGLHPWLALASAVALFAATNLLGGSGYLAVYLAGIVVANRPVRARADVLSVQDAATWFAQLVMFLLLGLLAAPDELLKVAWPALGVAAFLMFVARPVAVVLCLLPFGYRWPEIGLISWVGLRGAVGIFLASIPLLARLPHAHLYFNVAFLVVLVSLLVQGWTLARAAHGFGVAVPRADPNTRRIQLDLPGQLEYEMVGYRVAPGSAVLRGASLPGRVRLAMVVRDGQVLLARRQRFAGGQRLRVFRRARCAGAAAGLAVRRRVRRARSRAGHVRAIHAAGRRAARRPRGLLRVVDTAALRAVDRGRRCSTSGSTNRRRSATVSRWEARSSSCARWRTTGSCRWDLKFAAAGERLITGSH